MWPKNEACKSISNFGSFYCCLECENNHLLPHENHFSIFFFIRGTWDFGAFSPGPFHGRCDFLMARIIFQEWQRDGSSLSRAKMPPYGHEKLPQPSFGKGTGRQIFGVRSSHSFFWNKFMVETFVAKVDFLCSKIMFPVSTNRFFHGRLKP